MTVCKNGFYLPYMVNNFLSEPGSVTNLSKSEKSAFCDRKKAISLSKLFDECHQITGCQTETNLGVNIIMFHYFDTYGIELCCFFVGCNETVVTKHVF